MSRASSLVVVATAVAALLLAQASTRAQDATPVGSPGVAEVLVETLLDEAVDDLPGGHTIVYVDRWRFRPGPAALPLGPTPGPQLVVADAGTLVATVAGSEHRLAVGDTLVVPAGQDAALRNAGPDEAAALVVYLASPVPTAVATPDLPWDPAFIGYDNAIETSTDALPAGSARVVLRRLTLPPGAALPPYEATALDWIGVAAGRLGLTLEGEGLPFRWESGTEREFPAMVELPVLTPGWRVTLRNAGDQPLVLYRLTVTPAAGGTPAAGTPAP